MMICKTFGETTPLLLYSSPSVKAKFCQDKEGCHVSYSNTSVSQARPVGPLDITPQRRRLVLTGVWLGVFLASLNAALIATLLSAISSEFHATKQASWLGTSYLLANCAFTPLYGRLCDILGRRRANQLAIILAALGALLSAMSKSMPVLIAARFISGVGGGGSCITAAIITSDMYTLRQRSWIQGLMGVFFSAGQGIGGPLGGYIAERFGWRLAFSIQLPLYAISLCIIECHLRYAMPGKGKSTKEILKSIDYGGTISLMLSIAFFLAFLSFKYSQQLSFSEPRVHVTFFMTVIMTVIFIIFELCIASQPILSPSFLRQKVPVLIGMCNILVAISDLASLYFFPLYFERVMLTSTSTAGSHLLPASVAMALGCFFGGAIISKSGSYKTLGIVAAGSSFVGTLFLATLHQKSSSVVQWLSIVPLGFGNAIMVQTTAIALLAHVEPAQVAIAMGFAQLWRCVGQISGLAIPTAIFQQLIGRELTARITGPEAEEIIMLIRQSARNVHTLPYELQKHACDSYGAVLAQVFRYLAMSTFLVVLIQIAIPGHSLSEQPEEPKMKQPEGSKKSGGLDIERQIEKKIVI